MVELNEIRSFYNVENGSLLLDALRLEYKKILEKIPEDIKNKNSTVLYQEPFKVRNPEKLKENELQELNELAKYVNFTREVEKMSLHLGTLKKYDVKIHDANFQDYCKKFFARMPKLEFTSPKIIEERKKPGGYAQKAWSDLTDEEKLSIVQYNTDTLNISEETKSKTVKLAILEKPINPNETGLNGNGYLGKHGVNLAVDPVAFRFNDEGNVEIVIIKRGDGLGKYALPGGMVDKGEEKRPHLTAKRELNEEAFDSSDEAKNIMEKAPYKLLADKFVNNGDPRNTNESWIETIPVAVLVPNDLTLKAGDDAKKADFMELKPELLKKMTFGGHGKLILQNYSEFEKFVLDQAHILNQDQFKNLYDQLSEIRKDIKENYIEADDILKGTELQFNEKSNSITLLSEKKLNLHSNDASQTVVSYSSSQTLGTENMQDVSNSLLSAEQSEPDKQQSKPVQPKMQSFERK